MISRIKGLLFVVIISIIQIQQISAQLIIEGSEYNFGNVCDTTVNLTHSFKVFNKSDQPQRISRIVSSCICIRADYSKDSIPPQGFSMINITLNTSGINGEFEKPLVVKDGNGKNYFFKLKGFIFPLKRED